MKICWIANCSLGCYHRTDNIYNSGSGGQEEYLERLDSLRLEYELKLKEIQARLADSEENALAKDEKISYLEIEISLAEKRIKDLQKRRENANAEIYA